MTVLRELVGTEDLEDLEGLGGLEDLENLEGLGDFKISG